MSYCEDYEDPFDREDDEYSLEDEIEREEREAEENACAYGAECLCPHPYHTRSECFNLADAEALADQYYQSKE